MSCPLHSFPPSRFHQGLWKWRQGFKVKYQNLWVFAYLGVSDGNCFSVGRDVSTSPVSPPFPSDWRENKVLTISNPLKWWVGPAQLLSALKEGTMLDLPCTRQLLLPSRDSNGSCLGKKVHWKENTFFSKHWFPYLTPTLVSWLIKWVLYNYRLPVWKCLNGCYWESWLERHKQPWAIGIHRPFLHQEVKSKASARMSWQVCLLATSS